MLGRVALPRCRRPGIPGDVLDEEGLAPRRRRALVEQRFQRAAIDEIRRARSRECRNRRSQFDSERAPKVAMGGSGRRAFEG
jgi:hypothetical protein